MTTLEDALWISGIVIYVYLTVFVIPLVGTGILLLVSGRLTIEWIHTSGLLLMVVVNCTVFPALLYGLWKME